MKRQLRCVVFVAYTFMNVTAGGRGSPPLHGDFFASSTQAKVCQYRNPQSHFGRADTAVRPYAEDLERVARCCTAHPFCVGEILSISQAVTIPAVQRDARWNVERVGRKPTA